MWLDKRKRRKMRQTTRKLLIAPGLMLLAMLLSGCVTTGRADSFCAIAQPIYMDRDDIVSERTAQQILGHNLVGRALCSW